MSRLAALPAPADSRRAVAIGSRCGRRVRRSGAAPVPDVADPLVTKGAFVDTLEIRGEIRPLKSIMLSSPCSRVSCRS